MGQQTSFDSQVKDTTGNEMAKAYSKTFGQIIGKKFEVTISPKGRVLDIKGFKEILSSLENSSSDPTTKKLIESTFDEKKMISNFESSYRLFPEKPIKIGDTWAQKNTVESVVPIEINTGYKLKEVNNGIAKITSTGDVKMKSDDVEISGMKMKIDIAGKYDGTYDMDVSTGISNKTIINMPVNGTMSVMGMEVPVSINSTTQTTTTPAN